MLQRTKNQETLKILERLRMQGAPAASSIPMNMTQPGPAQPDDEEDPSAPGEGQPGPEPGEEPEEGDPGTSVQDNSLPGLKLGKKALRRRY